MSRLSWIFGGPGLALAAALALGACAAPSDREMADPGAGGRKGGSVAYATVNGITYREVGQASWYGKPFHGRRTASGERYDMHAMTAAHKTLPFGTELRVTNLDNKRAVVVKVNDRGPFVKGRILDVSRRAAERLGFRDKGVTTVRLEILRTPGG